MGRTALRRATVVLTAALVLTVTFSPGAHAADAGLTAAMLDTGDLPAGFTPDASLTGPLTAQRAQDLGLNPGQSWSRDTWVRTWLAADGAVVVEAAVDAGTGDHARAGAASGVSTLKEQGATRQPVAGFDVYGGFVGRYFELMLPLARGPYLFGLHVLVPASSAGSAGRLMSELGAAQVRKVPADTPDTARPSDAPGRSRGRGRRPHRLPAAGQRRRLPAQSAAAQALAAAIPAPPAGAGNAVSGAVDGATDVSAAAWRSSRIAVGRLAVQLAGLGLVAYAADVFQVRFWYAYLAAGLVVVWAGGRFIRPAGAGRGANRAIMAGSYRVLVTVMLVVASAMILFGLAAIVAFGLYQIQPPGATVQDLPGLPGLGLPGLGPDRRCQDLATGLAGAGLGLLVLGAVIFLVARRLGSVDARRLMLRDPRPPVLYLRSFSDDRLRLWTATLGRPSLVERFTPRRFDRFEEVLVRHLSRYGPVIAVNPPGTRLAPLGAARETIERPTGIRPWPAGWPIPPSSSSWPRRAGSPRDCTGSCGPSRSTASWTRRSWWSRRCPRSNSRPGGRPSGRRAPGSGRSPWPARWRTRARWCWRSGTAGGTSPPRTPGPSGPTPRPSTGSLGGPRRLARSAPAGPAGRALGTADAAGRGADRDGGRRHGGRGHLVRRGSGADGPDSGRQAFRPALAGTVQPVPTGRLGVIIADTVRGPVLRPADIGAAVLDPADYGGRRGRAGSGRRPYPGAAAIQAVMSRYFQAINGRDYAAYLATQSPGIAMTASQFQAGFESTQDSDVLVTGITTAPGGRPAADVTFTSRQQPQDGPEGESCTNWHVTMYFDGSAGT